MISSLPGHRKLLVLDDDPHVLNLLIKAFGADGVEVVAEHDTSAALRRIGSEAYDAAVVDIGVGERAGGNFLHDIRRVDAGLAVIMATGNASTQKAIDAMKNGAYDYVTKPFHFPELKKAVHCAFQCTSLNRGMRFREADDVCAADPDEADVMIGSSPEMVEIWKMVGRVAGTDATVLIQGESGTGKELLARAVYLNSGRVNRPFLAVNCAAIPESLLESELFGHEKGAFTDASIRRIGKFEQCHGGTIFLDEIGEMSLANQGKLLRVLENQEFQRVGGNETIKVDVRIIVATNRSLVNLVREKKFRIDLFYRLRVVSFYLPALRDRSDDIRLLAELFLRQSTGKGIKPPQRISGDALNLLKNQPWPGNIRELRNVIQSASVFAKGDVLVPEDLLPFLDASSIPVEVAGDHALDDLFAGLVGSHFDSFCRKNTGDVYARVTEAVEKTLVRLALERHERNQVLAAKTLGISRNTLRDRLERYNIG